MNVRAAGKGSAASRPAERDTTNQSPAPATFEVLEDRRLMSADPLAHVAKVQSLPYVLEFDAPVEGLHDKDGQDIGLTRVQVNENGQAASYLPANLDLRTDLGVLQVTTTGTHAAGTNYNGDNTLTNAVETQFDATTIGWKVSTRLAGPLGFLDHFSEQGGIFFGPDQDNYVKLVASATMATHIQSIELMDEQSSGTSYLHTVHSKTNVGPFSAINTLDLRLEGDATAGRVKAYYAINGGAYVKVAQELVLSGEKKAAFFTGAARAGLFTAHKNDVGPITVSYDRFEILPGEKPNTAARPSVAGTRPAAGATNVARDGYIAADLNLPNGGVDPTSLNAATVKLYRTSDGSPVAGELGTTGGGDEILFTPSVLLDPKTSYTFEVTDGVRDSTGAAFLPFATTFITAAAAPAIDPTLSFEKVKLPNTAGLKITSLNIGPDRKLYATADDGRILRYSINADGTLSTAQTITSLQTANGGNRLITGLAFDPAATAANPIVWVTHGQYAFGATVDDYADDWTSKVTRLSGANLTNVQDVLVNLPRSARDHLTNQPSFGPDGALYFPQGSNSSMGAPDTPWGNRPERLLSGAILRLDPRRLPAALPLDVKTSDGGGTYNPTAAGAALMIYASGVRNAYDLVWTRDGKLYAPTNGAAAGGTTPAAPGVPAIEGVKTTQHDFLFHIQPGGYYGHPNPVRNELVMGGGYTPANGVGVNEVPDYGTATKGLPVQPDANYRGYAWDFGLNISPNGSIEYQNTSAFGGMLAGKLLVTRYSGPGDLVVLTRNADGTIASQNTGIAGLKFVDPLDVTEDVASGNLYVADYGLRSGSARQIWLLRPIPPGAKIQASAEQMVFSDIHAPAHAGSSPNRALRITNTGTVPLTFPAGGIRVVDDPASSGDDSTLFKIVNAASLPDTLGVGESFDVVVNFTAPAVGIESAFLRILSNDAERRTVDVALRGVGVSGTGGANEPSLARILRAYQIPTIVGDGPNDSGDGDTAYPLNPDASSQEVYGMQRLVKAGSGPVTVEVLASEAFNNNPDVLAARFGHYKPGNRAADAKTELFTISGRDAQTLQATPNGTTSFDPGSSPFGLYATFPGFQRPEDGNLPREVFSEDALNLWDSVASRRHKVRFFPLRGKDGAVVPNAYIVAFEEFATAYDSNDLVAIVRNVKAAPAGPEIGLDNMDGTPFTDRLAFSKVQNYINSDRPNNKFHDTAVMRVRNTGSAALVLGTLSVVGDFALVSPPAAGTSIPAGGFLDLTVRFTATGGDTRNGTLTINSNDADEPATVVQLSGFWQLRNERGNEPTLQEAVNAFGFKTVIAHPGEILSNGGRIQRVGDEVHSPYWFQADRSAPITVRQLTAYHTQGANHAIHYHNKGSSTVTRLFVHDGLYGQSFLPPLLGSTLPAQAVFTPAAGQAIGWRVQGNEWSDPTKNDPPADEPQDQGHHLRFWVARDRSGAIIPDTYILSMDFSGINYDYNDNTYLITNVRPESAPKAPLGLVAGGGGGGIALDWADSPEPNVAGYNVYRAAAAGGPWTKLTGSPVTGSAFTDAFAPANATSYYYVTAVDRNGTQSAASAVVSASRSSDTVAPARPASLTAKGASTGITLDWADNTEADLNGYNILRGPSATGPWTKLNSSIHKTSSFVDLTAPSNATSYYQVVAVDMSGNTSSAAAASALRPASTTLPSAPSTTTATTGGPTRIDVSWSAASGASTYRVERRGPGQSTFSEIAANVTGTSYQDNAATAGATYAYRVRAENSAGLSAYGPTASATTPAAQLPPAAPAGATATAVNAGRIDVSWAASSGAATYRLERRGPGETAFREIVAGLTVLNFQDTAVSPDSTYSYRVRAENAAGLSAYGATASATTPAVVNGAYTGTTIGAPRPAAGSTTVVQEGLAYDLTAGGRDIIGTVDEFHFAHREVTGDFDVKVRLASLSRADSWTKAGLMVRSTLDPSSRNAFVMATPDVKGHRFTYRPVPGGTTAAKGTGIVSYPNTWLRLKREGDLISGFRSTDGQNWLLVGAARFTMPEAAYLGMALTSHDTAEMATAQFRDLADVNGNVPQPPAAPASLAATGASASRIDLVWAPSAGATSYLVERRSPTDAKFVQVASAVTGTTYADTSGLAAATTYAYRVRAVNGAGAGAYSPVATAATKAAAPTQGALTGVDVGAPRMAGATTEITAGRDYDVTAGGADISGGYDQFHFAHRQVTGDFDVKVRIQSLTQQDLFTKAGIMARTGLDPGSANVAAILTPSEKGARLQFRRTDGGITEAMGSGSAPAVFPDEWLRLKRVGDTFTSYRSRDGVNWTTFKSVTLALPQTMYLGLAAVSHNTSATTVAQFREFGNA